MVLIFLQFLILIYKLSLAQRMENQLICTASSPLGTGNRANIRRHLLSYEGGAAQEWTYETKDNERVKMMFSCEPNGFRVSIFFSKRACNTDDLNVYRVGFNSSDIPLLQKERVGPDEIVVQLEGASIQTKLAKCMDLCNDYNAVFQIPMTGAYRLKIIRLRNQWASVKSLRSFPKMQYEVFLDVLLTEPLEVYNPEFCGNGNGFWVTTDNRLSDWPVTIKQECSEKQSRGLKITSNVLLSHDFQAESCANEITSYRWNRKICNRDYHYDRDFIGEVIDPTNSSFVDLRITDSNYLKRTILFIGDLHIRDIATLFLTQTCRYQHGMEEFKINKINPPIIIGGMRMPYYEIRFSRESNNAFKAEKEGCGGSKEDKCQLYDVSCTDLTVIFIEAKFCEPAVVEKMKGVDYVVMNCGHFPAQSAHYTFGQFRSQIQSFFYKILESQILLPTPGTPVPTTLFWVENTAQPLRQDDYIIRTQDWRTYHRLSLYDAIVRDEAKLLMPGKMNYVPAFQSSFSVFDKTCNCGHYSETAILPQLIALLDVIRDTMLKKLR